MAKRVRRPKNKRVARSASKEIDKIVKDTPQSRVTKLVKGGKVERTKDIVRIRKQPILWAIPCDEIMYSMFFINFEKLANKMPWDGFAATTSTYLPEARNFLHNAFIEESDLPYMMMLDSDILFPPNLVDDLIAHDLPIVGGWYRTKGQKQGHPVVYDFVSETKSVNFRHRDQAGTGLEQVDGMGAGCWLMRRDVAEALGESPYNMNRGGEDLRLSRQLMKLDIPLHVDWDIKLAHAGVFFI